jgi:hypothetical protein
MTEPERRTIRLLTTLADMLANTRVLDTERGMSPSLHLTLDFALQFEEALEHAVEILAGLPDVEGEDEEA